MAGKVEKKYLEFMYFLTQQCKRLNSIDAAKILRKKGVNVTDRTIRRWFYILNSDRKFSYFVNAKYNLLGISSNYVLIQGLKDWNILSIVPYLMYVTCGSSIKNFEDLCLAQYHIPPEHHDKFVQFWKHAKQNGLIKSFSIFRNGHTTAFYQPFHKVIDKYGTFNFSKNDSNKGLKHYLNLLEKSLEDNEVKMHNIVIKNPIIVPMIYESFGEHYSSHKLWHNIKQKLGNDVWRYLIRIKKKKDFMAISHIQKLFKFIHKDFTHQVRVSYTPFYLNNVGIYFILKLKNKNKIINFIKDISKYSLQVVATIPFEIKKGFGVYYVVTESKALSKIMTKILPKYIKKNHESHIFFQGDYFMKNNTYKRVDYAKVFNPETCTWKYEHKRYITELDKLAKKM